jgi:uncharacterized protein YbaR (Trm112 family)
MEIKICPKCNGNGEFIVRERITNEFDNVVCVKCNGTGRVITRSYTYEVPFDFDKDLIRKADSQIFDIIRNLK